MEIFSKQASKISYEQLYEFLLKADHDFVPPLSTRVNLSNYASKLLKEAEVLTYQDAEKIMGLLAFYDNNTVSKMGYITYLAVDESYRGKGIAAQLLDECISYCKSSGMSAINVSTWESNTRVIPLYKAKGFVVTNIVDDRIGERSLKLTLTL